MPRSMRDLPLETATLNERSSLTLAELLMWHMLRGTRSTGKGAPWRSKQLAGKIGVDDRSVRNWLNGSNLPIANIEPLVETLFGNHLDNNAFKIEFLTRLNAEQAEKFKKPHASLSDTILVQGSKASTAPTLLSYQKLDELPVSTEVSINAIHYGEGVQQQLIKADRLFWLPKKARLTTEKGARRDIVSIFPHSIEAMSALARKKDIYFPREITVTGHRSDPDCVVMLHVCTDQPYEGDTDGRKMADYQGRCWIGRGGIAAFVDRHGALWPRSEYEVGEGFGCAVAIAAVAYRGGEPLYRTRYILGVRKGIRYPDDVWLSSKTGRPICFDQGAISSQRFIFQSREIDGNSTDIFIADYNGQRTCNVTEADESAWDGFEDDDGNEIVCWLNANTIQFCSNVSGKGFPEIITRHDCLKK